MLVPIMQHYHRSGTTSEIFASAPQMALVVTAAAVTVAADGVTLDFMARVGGRASARWKAAAPADFIGAS